MRYAFASFVGVVAAGVGSPYLRPPFPNPPHPDPSAALAAVLARDGYDRLSLFRGGFSGWYYVKVRVEGNPALLVVDTGGGDSCIETERVTDLAPRLIDARPAPDGRGGSIVITSPLYPKLTIGPIAAPRIGCSLIETGFIARSVRADGLARCDGILGAPHLHYYSAVIDYRSDSLFLRDPVKVEARLQGTWKGVETRHDGQVRRADTDDAFGLVIDGPTVTAAVVGKRSTYSLRLDLRTDPKGMDWVGPNGGAIPVIYHLDGDRLTLAGTIFQDAKGSFERPKGFGLPKGPGHTVAVFERVRGPGAGGGRYHGRTGPDIAPPPRPRR